MPAKLTTKDFIDRARYTHGCKYGYAFSVYQSTHEKVIIHCPEHGIFYQTPANHLRGRGCAGCFGTKKHNNESFIQKAREVHGNRCDYSLVEYNSNDSKVKIVCPKHGIFEQTPANHLKGRGCPDCGGSKKLTSEYFVQKAREFHGENTYDYSKVDYLNSRTKVKIVCPEHGDFEQTPNNHMKGNGCPGCAAGGGFDITKTGFLYVLRSDCGRYMKIGITHDPKQRKAQLSRSTPFSFKRIELIEGPGNQIANLEKELLSKYQQVGFTERFDGSTEWRLWDESIRGYFV